MASNPNPHSTSSWRGAAGLCARVRACAGAAESLHTYILCAQPATLGYHLLLPASLHFTLHRVGSSTSNASCAALSPAAARLTASAPSRANTRRGYCAASPNAFGSSSAPSASCHRASTSRKTQASGAEGSNLRTHRDPSGQRTEMSTPPDEGSAGRAPAAAARRASRSYERGGGGGGGGSVLRFHTT